MSYTTTEREIIAENIRQFLKQDQKEKFEEQRFSGDPFLVKRLLPMTAYDKDLSLIHISEPTRPY